MSEAAGGAAAQHQANGRPAALAADMSGIDNLAWSFGTTHHTLVYAPLSERPARPGTIFRRGKTGRKLALTIW
jgi:hypothetical protein